MVKPLGGGGAPEEGGDLLIGQEGLEKIPERRRLHPVGKGLQFPEHPFRIFLGHGKEFRRIDLLGGGPAGAHHGQLDGVFILHRPGLKIDEITLPEGPVQLRDVVPHLAVQLPRLILEAQVQIGSAFLGIGQVLFRHEEEVVNLFPRFDVSDIDIFFHAPPTRSGCV